MLTFVIAILTLVVGVWLARRAIERAKPLPLGPDEVRVTEMYAHTRDVTLRGFAAAGSALDGKLVLTTKRLVWTRYDEKRSALSLTPEDVLEIEVTEKGMLRKQPALRVAYAGGRRRKRKIVTWTAPERAVVRGNPLVFMSDKSYDNPNTVEPFARLLKTWKAGQPLVAIEASPPAPPEPAPVPKTERKTGAAARPGALICPECSAPYDLNDYRAELPVIYCSVCQAQLPRGQTA